MIIGCPVIAHAEPGEPEIHAVVQYSLIGGRAFLRLIPPERTNDAQTISRDRAGRSAASGDDRGDANPSRSLLTWTDHRLLGTPPPIEHGALSAGVFFSTSQSH